MSRQHSVNVSIPIKSPSHRNGVQGFDKISGGKAAKFFHFGVGHLGTCFLCLVISLQLALSKQLNLVLAEFGNFPGLDPPSDVRLGYVKCKGYFCLGITEKFEDLIDLHRLHYACSYITALIVFDKK